ncbi:MAG: ribokinase [Pseudomonadota bacterium]|nr:ribokinase [Pseudomonadota bacterium]
MGDNAAARVVVVGSFNVDHVWTAGALPRAGETLSGRYRTGPGGKGFNQATASARSGAGTAFVCALGDDAGGALARTLAGIDGIALRELRSSEPTGTAGIYLDAAGRNSIVIGPGANAALTAAFIESSSDCLRQARVVLAQLESPAVAVQAAFASARQGGALAILNPAPADAIAPPSLWSLADIVTPNETEFCAQFERHLGEPLDASTLAMLADDHLHAHCRRLLPTGTVVITLGAAGCFVSHAQAQRRGDDSTHYRVDAVAVDAVDTTGAGDAFNGALAASIASRDAAPFRVHVTAATRYAGASTERRGAADAMPRAADVAARFKDPLPDS